ncbi:Ig-like domain-containing protein [Clostridium sp. MB40-C1]|uniref:Ig-like domain-containing protein n=1 Tax=Clostridium sp. MB40-C1 TaxID=3070996 RepID=UPI0027DF42C1|nr:Ig-like domain-containing protein [Clostridium sp. MB40-C1]WMJ79321.1 Ig-like domain-containing protein [Clostridium sp. MB40-C1]
MKKSRNVSIITMIIFTFLMTLIPVTKAQAIITQSNMDKATLLSNNKRISETLTNKSFRDDRKYYKFNMDKDGKVDLTISHDKAYSDKTLLIELYDENGYKIKSSQTKGEEYKNTTYLPKGTYYIYVLKYASISSVSFDIKVNLKYGNYYEKEPNGSIETANDISLDTSYIGTSDDYYDDDYYKFYINKDGKVIINFGYEPVEGIEKGTWRISIEDTYGTLISEYITKTDDTSFEKNISLSKGTYLVKIKPYSGKGVDLNYSLKVKFSSDNTYEKEPNDSLKLSTPIDLNREYNGAISSKSDNDYYSFVLGKPQPVEVKLYNYNIKTKYPTLMQIKIVDAAEKEVVNTRLVPDYIDNVSYKVTLDKGTYYVHVFLFPLSYFENDLDYSIKVIGDSSSPTIDTEGFKSKPTQTNVSPNKTWEINFSGALDIKTITEKNIYVLDSNKSIVPMLYVLDTVKNNKISVTPVKDYNRGETYTLYIKDLKSTSGKILKERTKMDFVIQK